MKSELKQWPIQIKLIDFQHQSFDQATLLIAADCCAYAFKDFHDKFIKDKVTIIGCPKLDDIDYSNKLTEIISNNDIKKIVVVRMEVPCCMGIEDATRRAIKNADKDIELETYVITLGGEISA
ncbi:hypothetical protein LJB88_00260 [Erysipelotrichaceae bacterium OttesenSCG-928-M19]|nr:hypothetical protein [Erysipelotrichaceae bacterium OttesenSCG-928-M19]